MNEKLTAPGSRKCPKCGAGITDDAAQGLCPACLMAAAAWQTDAGTQPAEHVSLPKLEEVAAAFPDLEIVEVIGQGGMGVVYKARQPRLDRFVALKILQPAHGSDPRFAERFEREAQALAKLSHPNIVTIHDFGQAGGYYFLLMEFVDGVNLRQAMRAGRFTPEQALAIVPPVCEALQFAHEHGIVHRDIKPENLLLDKDGRVKIADFGIAKMYGSRLYSSHLAPRDELGAAADTEGVRSSEMQRLSGSTEHLSGTERATVLGTPRYMAPEQQSDPLRVDHRADIYSLGVVLYELLTGEAPGSKLTPPSQRVQIDVRLDEIVLRALNVKPEMRWQTAAEFQTQVESIEPHQRTQQQAIESWLAIMDRGDYAGTWTSAAIIFHSAITQAAWVAKCEQVRRRLGAVISRTFRETRELAPRRHEMKFDTCFEGLTQAVETITFILDKEDRWSVVGYLIRPAASETRKDAQQRLYHAMGYHTVWGQRLLRLSFIGFLSFLGFLPGLEALRILMVFFTFMGIATVIEWRHRIRAGESPKSARSRWHKALITIAMAILIVIPLRAWVIEAFVIPVNSMAPEMPAGSRVLVWKLTSSFAPGDIVAHRHGKQVWVSRVVRREEDRLVVQRNQWPEEKLPMQDVIGKVVSVYWRASPLPKSAMLGSFKAADSPISKLAQPDGDGWRVDATEAQVVKLFELPVPNIDDCTIIYRAKLKSENVKGRAFLEMWCRVPGFGEAFSRGLDKTITGTNDWASYEIPFFLKKGEKADHLKLNLNLEGAGRVWIKDIEVLANGAGVGQINSPDPGSTAEQQAKTPPTTGTLREQLQVQLTERSAKLGPAHPDVILLRQTLADMAKREDDAPAVSDAENTSERLLNAVVKPIEFAVGEQRFAPGDSITIESVEATSPALGRGDIVVVKGRFVLQSANEAMLALYLGHKANGGRSKTLPEQTRMIAKGSGMFELRCAINYEGRLHVRFYPKDGSGAFGEIWVGTPAQADAVKPKSLSSSPAAIPRPAITPTASDKAGVVAQIQTAFDAVAKLKNMEQGQRYEVPVGGVPELSPGDDFLRRRTGREIFDSGLSCGCGDHALAFMHLMEPSGLELLMVDGAQISFRALETHWSGHVVVAVKVPKDGPWILVDPTQRKIIDENWQRDAKSFYDGRYWIGYAGPISGYPAHTPDELRAFLGKTLATVPPEVFARQMMKFRFKLDASMFDASGKCVNANAEKMNELQESLLKKFKITPAREIDVLLIKGGDDASGVITFTEDRGWVATVGLRSGCSSGYIDYMNQQVSRKLNVR